LSSGSVPASAINFFIPGANSLKKKADPPPKKLPAAALEERRRISRELHDRALQMLSTVRLRAEICRRELMHNPPALEKELQTIEETTEKAITEIRNLLAETQSWRDLKAGSLERRLKEELDIFRARTGFKLEFVCAIRVRHLPYDMERELYFTLREGILNAVRHARATELHLRLTQDSTGYEATLRDNGVGFSLSSAEGSGHYGLKGMRERIQKIGGELTVDTAPGEGTEISIAVPFRQK
jgi:two-component system sensor histidine kinase DegS